MAVTSCTANSTERGLYTAAATSSFALGIGVGRCEKVEGRKDVDRDMH